MTLLLETSQPKLLGHLPVNPITQLSLEEVNGWVYRLLKSLTEQQTTHQLTYSRTTATLGLQNSRQMVAKFSLLLSRDHLDFCSLNLLSPSLQAHVSTKKEEMYL